MKKRLLVSLGAVLLLVAFAAVPVAVAPAPALAADYQEVTVSVDPLYLAITNSPGTWLVAGLTGSGYAATDTVYYSNPGGDTTAPSANVTDGECRFTVTCSTGATTCDLTVTCADFTGGDANMTNSNTGDNGATSYGAYCWRSGQLYSNKVIMKSSGSSEMYSLGLDADASLKWGAEIETQTNSWSGGSTSTATMTITATAH